MFLTAPNCDIAYAIFKDSGLCRMQSMAPLPRGPGARLKQKYFNFKQLTGVSF